MDETELRAALQQLVVEFGLQETHGLRLARAALERPQAGTYTHADVTEAHTKGYALGMAQQAGTGEPSGYVTGPIIWKRNPFQSEQVVKITRHPQPEHGFTTPLSTPEGAPASVQATDMRSRLQKQCSDWGAYWRASDAHGVELTKPQAIELLADALGVEVEIRDNGCVVCDGTGKIGDQSCECAAPEAGKPVAPVAQPVAVGLRDEAYAQIDRFLRNNLDDTDYADYSQALDLIFVAPSPAANGAAERDAARYRQVLKTGVPFSRDVSYSAAQIDWLLDKHLGCQVGSFPKDIDAALSTEKKESP